MKGILLKDFYTLKRTIWIYLAMILVFCITQGESGTTFVLFYAIMLPINLIAIEERSRFERLAPMLPISRLQNVLDKYIVAYICTAVAPLAGFLYNLIGRGVIALSPTLLYSLALCLFSQAITLPLTFRFGIENGRMIYTVSILGQAALLGTLAYLAEEIHFLQYVPLGALVFVLALGINICSIFVAQKLYEQRILA